MNSRKKEANAKKDATETGKMELIQEAVQRNIRGGGGCIFCINGTKSTAGDWWASSTRQQFAGSSTVYAVKMSN